MSGVRRRDHAGLTAKERLFVYEYLKDRDSRAAMMRAGYTEAYAQKHTEMMARPHVAEEVQRGLEKVESIAVVDAARVLEELARVALADPRKLFDKSGNLKPIQEWTAAEAACVGSVEVVKRNLVSNDGQLDTVIKIRMWDKPKGLEILAKHLGMLTERLEITGDAELLAKLAGARQRAMRLAVEVGE